jgi:outer membrane protein assembly factor BamB
MVKCHPGSPGIAERHFLGFLVLLLSVSGGALAQSGPSDASWPIFRHDPQLSGRALTTGPSIPQINWIAEFGAGQLGTPTVGSDGTIYVSGRADNHLYALDANGLLKWQFTATAAFVAPAAIGATGVVYVGSTSQTFYAINPDGSERWSIVLDGAIRFSANFGDDGTIYLVADDCRLHALSPDGVIKWQQSLERPPINAPAIGADRSIFTVAGEFLASYRPTGTLRWQVSFADMGQLGSVMTDLSGNVYITSLNAPIVRAVRAADGREIWTFSYRSAHGSPSLLTQAKDGGIFFTTSQGARLYALNKDGSERWNFSQHGNELRKSPVIDDSSFVYIVNDSLGLISFGAAGAIRWNLNDVRGCNSAAFANNGTLYAVGNSKLYAIGEESSHISRLEIVSGDNQRGCAGNTLPISLEVLARDQRNNPFPNQRIRFSVIAGGGSLSESLVITDSAGKARTQWTLGAEGSSQEVRAFPESPNIPPATSMVTFKATVLPAQISGPNSLDFGALEIGARKELSVFITGIGDCPIRIDSARIAGADAPGFTLKTNGLPTTLGRTKSLNLKVSFNPQRTGAHSANLRVFNNAGSSPFDIGLSGEGVCTAAHIGVTPASAQFGRVALGDSKSSAITVANIGCDTLRITELRIDSPTFRIDRTNRSFILPPTASRDVLVFFSPQAAAADSAVLIINSNDFQSSPLEINLFGQGQLPWIVSPTVGNFGLVCVSDTASLELEISNLSGRDLTAGSLRMQPASFAVADNGPLVIAANSSTTLRLNFSPNTQGVTSGKLSVSWLPGLQLPDLEVPLSGEGIVTRLTGPASIRFGSIPVGTSMRVDSTFRNETDCDIVITELNVLGQNAAGFQPDRSQLPQKVQAGASVQVGIHFTASHSGICEAELVVKTRGSSDSLKIRLVATVTSPDISISDSVITSFSAFCAAVIQSLAIRNRGDDFLDIEPLKLTGKDSADFRISKIDPASAVTPTGGLRVNPRDSVKVDIVFEPTGSGARAATLLIDSNDPRTPNLRVELQGLATDGPDIDSDTRLVDFDSVSVDTTVSRFLTINNRCSRPLALTELSTGSSSFSAHWTAQSIAPFDSAMVTISFSPTDTLLYADTLRIVSNDPDENPYMVELRGVGKAPDIDIETAQQNPPGKPALKNAPLTSNGYHATASTEATFGKVCVNSTNSRFLTVHNRGNAELIVDSLRTDSRYFAVFPTTGFTIPAYGNRKVELAFSPDTCRQYSGSLRLWSNDPDEGISEVLLTGEGIFATLTVSGEPVFGAVAVGHTAEDWVEVKNIGTPCGTAADTAYLRHYGFDDRLIFSLLNPQKAVLDSGATVGFRIGYAPQQVGPDSIQFVMLYNDRKDSLVHKISGNGVRNCPTLILSTERLDLGAVTVGDTVYNSTSLFFRNPGTDSLIIRSLVMQANDAQFWMSGLDLPISVAPQQSSEPVRVYFSPKTSGQQNGKLSIGSNHACGDNQQTVNLAGIGTYQQICLQVSSTDLNFGRVALSSNQVELITIKNCGNSEIALEFSTSNDREFLAAVEATALASGDSISLPLIFKPATVGSRQAVATIHPRSGTVSDDIRIALQGEGFIKGQPKVSVSPNPFTPNGDGFNDSAVFDFSKFDLDEATLKVFTLNSRLVRSLEYVAGARREIQWNGLDEEGRQVSPGLFIYILEADGRRIDSGHVVVIR